MVKSAKQGFPKRPGDVCDHRRVPLARPIRPSISVDFETRGGGWRLARSVGAGTDRRRHLPTLAASAGDEPASPRSGGEQVPRINWDFPSSVAGATSASCDTDDESMERFDA
jgi:hypothetical protein